MSTATATARAVNIPDLAFLQLVFVERCAARAILYAARVFTLHEAVDELQNAAEMYGLILVLGDDAVQAIMADAFRPFRFGGIA